MPTYGYQCTACKYEFSVFQNMKDDPISSCPQCGEKVKRLLYPVGIVFKGSGWYINDSRAPEKSEKSESAEKSDKPGKSEKSEKAEPAAASSESSGDAKPAAPAAESKPSSSPAPAAPPPAK